MSDPLVKQFYMPSGTEELGVTTIEYCGDKVRIFDLERLLIETARMKGKLAPDMYKEVVLSFRRRSSELEVYKIAVSPMRRVRTRALPCQGRTPCQLSNRRFASAR